MRRWSAACLLACPLGQAFETQDLPEVALVLWSCVPSLLSVLSLCLWCVACKYAFVSHFKGVLTGFVVLMWVCIVRVLCVACGAFVCVSG